MKNFISFFLLVFLLSACNNKLNIDAPYKDITVVYGLLDQNDTAHYIRINKAYLGVGNALTMAQQYDSINYPAGTLSAVIKDYDAFGDPPTTIPLGTTMNIPVVPGVFSYPNQIEYYTKAVLNPNDTFKLVITNNRTGKVITGSASLIPDVVLGTNGVLSWAPQMPYTISWITIPNGDIYQLTMRFFYTETNGANSTLKYVDWVFSPQTTIDNLGGIFLNYKYSGTDFLHLLHSLIPPATAGISRTGDSLQVIFTTGSQDFLTYFNLSQPPLGINQDKPFYSDVKNGIGIFTARHTQYIYNRKLSFIDNDSIETESITSNLGFAP
jgi:hypothetical protein